MGKGADPNCATDTPAPKTVRRGEARELRSQFSGFTSEDKQASYARAALERAGVKEGETVVVDLGGAGADFEAAAFAFEMAALEMGVNARIYPPDSVLSQEEFLEKQYLKKMAALGMGTNVTLGSFGNIPAISGMEHEDLFNESQAEARKRILEEVGATIARKRNEGDYRSSWSMWPTAEWASQVYPDLSAEEAQARLADCLARATFADDPEGRMKHMEELKARADDLNDFEVDEMEIIQPPASEGKYKDHPLNRGTHLTIGMAEEQSFLTCDMETSSGDGFGFNNPSDEIFGTPSARSASGHITTTRPVVVKNDEREEVVIEGIYMEFKDGEMTHIESFDPEHQELVKKIFSKERMADAISEVGLVSADNALAQETHNGKPVLFHQIVCDENTGVHLGFGSSYTRYTGGRGISEGGDAADPMGMHGNQQQHHDLVIGGSETQVIVRNKRGQSRKVIESGVWFDEHDRKEEAPQKRKEKKPREVPSPDPPIRAEERQSTSFAASIKRPGRAFGTSSRVAAKASGSQEKTAAPSDPRADSSSPVPSSSGTGKSKGSASSGSAPKRLSKSKRIAQLKEIHAKNPQASNKEIAQMMGGVSATYVSGLRKEAGLPTGRRGRPKGSRNQSRGEGATATKRMSKDKRIAQLKAIYEENPQASNKEVAEMMGVSPMRVSQIRRAAGLSRGKRGRPKKNA